MKLDIQFQTKGIHLLSTLIFKDDSLKMLKHRSVNRLSSSYRKKKFYLGFGLSDLRTIRPSDYPTFRLSDLRTIGPSYYRTVTIVLHVSSLKL